MTVSGGRKTKRNSVVSFALFQILLLLLASAGIVLAPAHGDPVVDPNPDGTRQILWAFDDVANYTLNGTAVSGGLGKLEYLHESLAQNTSASFQQGVRFENVSAITLNDSVTLDGRLATVYNITIQPASEGTDTHIHEGMPTTNYGSDDFIELSGELGATRRALFRFDFSSMPANAVIVDAKLWLASVGGTPTVLSFGVYMLSKPFNELTATWNENSTGYAWTAPGGDYDPLLFESGTLAGSPGVTGLDISRLADLWVGKKRPNNGIILVPSPTLLDSRKRVVSSDDTTWPALRPKIVVNYTLPRMGGVYESAPFGPATNSTFTLASWTNTTFSFATDQFDGTDISSRWEWLNDPFKGTGWYDVGTNPGWLTVVGDGNPGNDLDYSGINYMHQNISGDFVASTFVMNLNPHNDTGSGILVFDDEHSYVGVYLMGEGSGSSVFVLANEGGTESMKAIVPWVGYNWAFFTIIKTSAGIMVLASSDGTFWSFTYTYIPPAPYMERLWVGPFVASNSMSIAAASMFQYFTIEPLDQTTQVDMRAKVGNTTSLLDLSWRGWSDPLPSQTGSYINETGKYIQYQATLSSPQEWFTPVLTGFYCDYERYASKGTIETEDFAPPGFNSWVTLSTAEDDSRGSALYSYSTDHGENWTKAVPGGSYSITSDGTSIKIRIYLSTDDTLLTPSVDSIKVIYEADLYTFWVTTPSSAVAGEAFEVTIEARDESNNTATSWRGPVMLEAMDETGNSTASGRLEYPFAWITEGGKVTISNEKYYISETIRIRASSGSTVGIGEPTEVHAGPPSLITINPNVTQVLEYSEREFVATAYDAYGNIVPDALYTWAADAVLGTLSTNSGRYVTLTTDGPDVEGYLNVTSGNASSWLYLRVVPHIYPPEFIGIIPEQVKDEDSGTWALNISAYVSDPEDSLSALRWFTTNETLVEITGGENETGNLEIELSTVQDRFGYNNLTLVVVDSTGMMNSTTIPIILNGINDRPSIGHIAPLIIEHDSPYTYDFTWYVDDVDDSHSQLMLSVDSANDPYATIDGMSITFTYPSSMIGSDIYVPVTVDDGELSSSTIVRVTVSENIVPEQIESLPSLVIDQGEEILGYLNLSECFSNPDGDILTFSAVSEHVSVVIQDNGTVDFLGPTDWYGQEYVVFVATDPSGTRVEDAMLVTVIEINQAPTIEAVPNLEVRYDLRYEFDLLPYLNDPNDPEDTLMITTNDSHISVLGSVISLLYPRGMNGTTLQVMMTASDGELSDSCAITVTISDNRPPVLAIPYLPGHEFMEDVPVPYPVGVYLEDLFTDPENGSTLTFYAFGWDDEIDASASSDAQDDWSVWFEVQQDFYGECKFTVRAMDVDGAIAERTVALTVLPLADPPSFELPAEMNVTEGARTALDLSIGVSDPDPEDIDFTFEILGTNPEHLEIQGSVLVGEFPEGFVEDGEDSRTVSVQVRVIDPNGLAATDTMDIIVVRAPGKGGLSTWVYGAIAGLVVTSATLAAVTWTRRKKPFVVQDMMLIHNDGLLIGRQARDQPGAIDENIMSGMLTAVLNFVEDSMSANQDTLKSFGFEHYMVLVQRGEKAYAAIVYDGDAPEQIGKELGSFLEKIEKVYKHSLEEWSGDLANDFPAIGMLIQNFVKEHSRKGDNIKNMWVSKKAPEGGKPEQGTDLE